MATNQATVALGVMLRRYAVFTRCRRSEHAVILLVSATEHVTGGVKLGRNIPRTPIAVRQFVVHDLSLSFI